MLGQENYRAKANAVFKEIFYKGAILILKKAKYFRRKDTKAKYQNGFNGITKKLKRPKIEKDVYAPEDISGSDLSHEYKSDIIEEFAPNESGAYYNDLLYRNLNAKFNFDDGFDYFDDIYKLDDLQDIRDSPAYKVYSVLTDKALNFEENNYKSLDKQQRKKLRQAVAVEITLLLRRVIEESVVKFEKFFSSFKTIRQLQTIAERPSLQLGTLNELDEDSTSNIQVGDYKSKVMTLNIPKT